MERMVGAMMQQMDATGVTLTLPDGRVMRQCLPCAMNEHEGHVDDVGCDGCAICATVRSDYPNASGS